MPLDPNIFFQGAQLRNQQNAQLLNTLNNAADAYVKQKQFNQTLDFKRNDPAEMTKRLEGVGTLALFDAIQGKELTPERRAAAEFVVRSNNKPAFDPSSNRLIMNNPFGGILDKPAASPAAMPNAMPQAPVGLDYGALTGGGVPNGNAAPMPPVQRVDSGIDPMAAPPMQPNMALANTPEGQAIAGAIPASAVGGNVQFAPKPDIYSALTTVQQPPTPANNPAALQSAIEGTTKANIENAQKAAGVPIKQAEAQASKTGEISAEVLAAKPKALSSIRSLISSSKNISEAANRAASQTNFSTAGDTGEFLSKFPIVGQGYRDLSATLEQIRGDAFLTGLAELKQNSSSGASGLGAVTEREGQKVEAARGAALAQNQSPKQLEFAIKNYDRTKASAIKNIMKSYKDTYGEEPNLGDGQSPNASENDPLGLRQLFGR